MVERAGLSPGHQVTELRHQLDCHGQRGRERLRSLFDHALHLVGEQPPSLGGDRDRDDLVTRRIEGFRKRYGGDALDVWLGRSTAEQQQDADATRRAGRAHQTTWNTARIPRPMRNNPTRPYSSSVRPRIDSRYWNARPTVRNTRNP